MYKGILPTKNLPIHSRLLPSNCGRDPRQFLECQHHDIHTTENQHFNSLHYYPFFFLPPGYALPVHNSLICICYNSSPWGGFGSFCKSRIKCFHRFNLGWSCQHRGRRCRRSSWGRGSIYTVSKRDRKTRIERNLVLVTCITHNN